MNNYVLIFHQAPNALSESQKQQRARETAAWARPVRDAGHALSPRILGPERFVLGCEGEALAGPGGALVTALLFIEAADLKQAADVAASHPALGYGAIVEVRPWAVPIPPTAPGSPTVR